MTTTAQEISARFGDDGQSWTVGGIGLDSVVESLAVRGLRCFGAEIWFFEDGSEIVITENWWDVLSAGFDSGGHQWTTDGEPTAPDFGEYRRIA